MNVTNCLIIILKNVRFKVTIISISVIVVIIVITIIGISC